MSPKWPASESPGPFSLPWGRDEFGVPGGRKEPGRRRSWIAWERPGRPGPAVVRMS